MCDDGASAGPDGVDESGSDDAGSDDTGMGVGPFGEIDDLVSCIESTCTVEDELFSRVMDAFGTFYDEGVRAERVDLSTVGPGVRLSGLDAREHATALLATLGLHDGDVITHVDDMTLDSDARLHQLLAEVSTSSSWTLTIRRRAGSTWRAVERTIVRAP